MRQPTGLSTHDPLRNSFKSWVLHDCPSDNLNSFPKEQPVRCSCVIHYCSFTSVIHSSSAYWWPTCGWLFTYSYILIKWQYFNTQIVWKTVVRGPQMFLLNAAGAHIHADQFIVTHPVYPVSPVLWSVTAGGRNRLCPGHAHPNREDDTERHGTIGNHWGAKLGVTNTQSTKCWQMGEPVWLGYFQTPQID